MRFLCLHGKGTNSQTLEVQLSAVKYQLGDGHTYEFVEGTVPEEAAPEIHAIMSPSEKYFGYFDEHSPQSVLDAVNNLERYIDIRGPFDGLIAFSQGGVLASTLLVRQARRGPNAGCVRVAMFFSGLIPVDPDLLERGVIAPLDHAQAGEMISIPTVHVWGAAEQGELPWPPKLYKLCKGETREQFQHTGGHEIPSSKDRVAVAEIVQKMRRAIWRADVGSAE
ncbi:hypothetical protein K458DRAFT_288949 [Lentithecium fluviatile CBS 122367]|uniref:Serine hydrolase domain-containing protein n=1 Tax=Lentithecium fluviatile CBS 122367 TaxID=1168545 RepID=A0A6G1JJD3_9PLEO|nr:hypothetical protein K458DRAFT_288949 [Lentithecium fluviatile CBS 122367]